MKNIKYVIVLYNIILTNEQTLNKHNHLSDYKFIEFKPIYIYKLPTNLKIMYNTKYGIK
jgi:hypothetical protein